MAKQLQRRCHVPLQSQMSILLVLKVSNEMALGQLEWNYFWRFGEGILLLQVNSGTCCQVHQLQPAPSVGPGKICSQSSSAAAAAPSRTEPLGQEWLGQESHLAARLWLLPGEGPSEKSISETVSVSKPHKTDKSQIQSLLNWIGIFPGTLIGFNWWEKILWQLLWTFILQNF